LSDGIVVLLALGMVTPGVIGPAIAILRNYIRR
jgi:hypothetical protein